MTAVIVMAYLFHESARLTLLIENKHLFLSLLAIIKKYLLKIFLE